MFLYFVNCCFFTTSHSPIEVKNVPARDLIFLFYFNVTMICSSERPFLPPETLLKSLWLCSLFDAKPLCWPGEQTLPFELYWVVVQRKYLIVFHSVNSGNVSVISKSKCCRVRKLLLGSRNTSAC